MHFTKIPNACTDCTAAGRAGLVIIENRHLRREQKFQFRCRCIYCGKTGDWVEDKRHVLISWNENNPMPKI